MRILLASLAALLICGDASTCGRVQRVQRNVVRQFVPLEALAVVEVPFVPVQLIQVRQRVLFQEVVEVQKVVQVQKVVIQKNVVVRQRLLNRPVLNRQLLPLRARGC